MVALLRSVFPGAWTSVDRTLVRVHWPLVEACDRFVVTHEDLLADLLAG